MTLRSAPLPSSAQVRGGGGGQRRGRGGGGSGGGLEDTWAGWREGDQVEEGQLGTGGCF